MSQLIQRNDSFAISCDRGEFDVLSVQCEGAHFVIGTVYDDAVTFEGKLVVVFYLLDACRCTISEGGNLGVKH